MSGDRPADDEPLVVLHQETVVVTTAAPDARPVLPDVPVAPDPTVPAPRPPDPAELAAAAALAVPGVAGLYPGTFGEIATHLPGRRVAGVRTRSTDDGTSTDVHVVALLGGDLREVAAAVHRAVHDAVGGDVHVTVDDVVP
ncbi:Asp23/Gls24 family envelope stress response protein [Cellulomonas dongxiuzhuiae]|uniref:Asp23/Gls24 family envelope stress response protein n=1 Tax=Cellulomonas dongxiuzhuiae TaxID=2819979 RepID=UPI001AAEB660|nr:Asp23/Gls24 family envelope stress response protein [Cellulomonas dongxiuzhuiae]MBO3089696.1 Asp23/Gls24 family envelope stress response protein [Cellulomonas dongxiuzhuiae]